MANRIGTMMTALRCRVRPTIGSLRRWRMFRALRLAHRYWRARHGGLPDWSGLLPATASGNDGMPANGKRVLIATGTAGHLPSMMMESYLAVVLGQRGAETEFLICDGALPACMMCETNWYPNVEAFARKGPSDQCGACHRPSAEMLDAAGLSHTGLSRLLTPADLAEADELAGRLTADEIPAFRIDGVALGEHAMAGALRFFARGDLPEGPATDAVLKRYLKAAVLTFRACRNLFSQTRFDVVVLNHGIYIPQGVIAETARQAGIRVVTWHPAYRRGCFIFNHDETYHHGLMNEPASAWQDMRWDDGRRDRIATYLRSRWVGRQDWVQFHHDPIFDVASIEKEIGIDLSRPTVGLLTNVVWDAQLHYPANAFESMIDWLTKTIGYFAGRPELQLMIRIHPAEHSGTLPSRQPVMAEIESAFPQLPENVFIIPADSRLSTYAAISPCNAAIIFGTKMGVELTATGMPVIVAGEAWIRGKGVTMDAASQEDYFRLLDSLPLPGRLEPELQERALKYAYHFFFRRMIPLKSFVETGGWPPFAVSIDSLEELAPGVCKGLDVVCDGILEGTPFVYPAEEEEAGNARPDARSLESARS